MKSFVFPGNIEPEILAIASQQVPYMRTQWFSDLVLESEEMFVAAVDAPNGKMIPYTASGTAAMDACIVSFVSTCRKALVVNGGTFGARWADLCRFYKIDHDEFPVGFGKDPDWDLLARTVDVGEYDVVLMQHHETSSGYLYDLKKVSDLCRKNGAYLVVDAISSFLADRFSMLKCGVDIAIFSSQKGLDLPPGLSFVILNDRVLQRGGFAKKSYYLEWERHLSNLVRGQTPYSPATHLFMQLHARLKLVHERGVPNVIANVARKANFFRKECVERGWAFSANRMSNCVTGLYLPFTARPLVNSLMDKEIYVMPCGQENMIRVAHLGIMDEEDHLQLIEEIEKWEMVVRK